MSLRDWMLMMSAAMQGGGAGAAGQTTLFSDTFTDEDSTALTAHTPDVDTVGGGYSNIMLRSTDTPVFNSTVQSNQAALANVRNGVAADVADADVEITVDFIVPVSPGALRAAVIGRYASDGNHFFLVLSVDTGTVTLRKAEANALSDLDTAAFTFDPGTYAVKLVCSGTSIQGYIDDVLQVEATSSFNQAETEHGIMCTNTVTAVFDNLVIKTNP